eukprot:SAG31_NODE_42159_length_270_cov_14.479769_1_plen_54_part_10
MRTVKNVFLKWRPMVDLGAAMGSYVHGINLVNGNVTWEFKKNKLYSYHITILIL